MHRNQHIHFTPDSRGGRSRGDRTGRGDRSGRGGRGGHRGRGGHGGRHRARRGAIVEAVLLLLDERPMHGYELITELEARSEGRWRPSPGTMYPALNRMEAHGLLISEEVDSTKRFSLSDAGRERLDAYLADRDEDAPAPWNEHASGGRGDLRRRVGEIVGQARQIGRFGSPEQIDKALAVFDDTRRRLYEILAAGDAAESATESSSDADRAD